MDAAVRTKGSTQIKEEEDGTLWMISALLTMKTTLLWTIGGQ
jgi:hypothetical protein